MLASIMLTLVASGTLKSHDASASVRGLVDPNASMGRREARSQYSSMTIEEDSRPRSGVLAASGIFGQPDYGTLATRARYMIVLKQSILAGAFSGFTDKCTE